MDEKEKTLHAIFQPYKGILAADERQSSLDKRLKEYGLPVGEEARASFRTMLFTAPNVERTLSGVILSEDTLSHHSIDGEPTVAYLTRLGIVAGVKVDGGLEPYTGGGETELFVTKGLDGLSEKCADHFARGARFLKWRSVIPVSGADDAFLESVFTTMTEYASVGLRHNLVPIVEPEMLLAGDHTLDEAAETLERIVSGLLAMMRKKKCAARHCILKTSFAVSGLNRETIDSETVAKRTIAVLKRSGAEKQNGFHGIAFLSGGLPSKVAIEYIQRIKAIAEQDGEHSFDTPITFSYARALQDPALREWDGTESTVLPAQVAFTQTLQHAIKKYKGVEQPSVSG